MWKVTAHKRGDQKQEIEVSILVKELATYEQLTYSESFIGRFKEHLKNIPKSNNFSADVLYKAKEISLTEVEIWKLTLEGDFKYKMFTLEYIKE